MICWMPPTTVSVGDVYEIRGKYTCKSKGFNIYARLRVPDLVRGV